MSASPDSVQRCSVGLLDPGMITCSGSSPQSAECSGLRWIALLGQGGPLSRPGIAGLLVLCLACGVEHAPSAGPSIAEEVAADAGDDAAPCHKLAARPGGGCCPAGHVWHYETGLCGRVGPPSCADAVAAAGDCVPRWCADWTDAADQPCEPTAVTCWPHGRGCTVTELAAGAGCLPGWWPDPAGDGACAPAGSGPGLVGLAAGGTDDIGLAAIAPLPDQATPKWCWQVASPVGLDCGASAGDCPLSPRPCNGPEELAASSCAAGTWPTGDRALCGGTALASDCPPGFVATGSAKGAPLAGCVADPADCGQDKWGGASGPGVLHVSADAAPGGDGSAAAPFATTMAAVAAAPTGGTIVLAAGTYAGQLDIDRPMTLRGRCAAMVKLTSTGKAVIATAGKPQTGKVVIEGVRLGGSSPGLVSLVGPNLLARRVWTEGVLAFGAVASGGRSMWLEDSLISGVRQAPGGLINGIGAIAQSGGQLHLSRVRISDCDHANLLSIGAGSVVHARHWTGDAPRRLLGWGPSGSVVAVSEGGQLLGHDLRLVGPAVRGVAVMGKDSRAWITGMTVTGLQPPSALPYSGAVLEVADGARVELAGAHLHHNGATALRAGGQGSVLRIGGVSSHATQAHTLAPHDGLGAVAFAGGALSLMGSALRHARTVGVLATGEGTSLELVDSVIAHTQASSDGAAGPGVSVELGSHARLVRTRLHRSRYVGLTASGQGTEVHASGLLIDNTQVLASAGWFPAGLLVEDQARVWLTGGRLSANVFLGMDVLGGTVFAAGLLVDHGQPGLLTTIDPSTGEQTSRLAAFGARVIKGGRLFVSGGRLSRMISASVMVSGSPSRLAAQGMLIDHTLLEGISGKWGLGLLVADGGHAELNRSSLVANRTATALILNASLHVTASLVAATRPADYLPAPDSPMSSLADGLIAGAGATLQVVDAILRQMPRAGVLVQETGSAAVSTSVLTDNGFGVAAQQGGAVTVKQSAAWANTMQNVSTGQMLEVPPPPGVVFGP